MSAGARWPAAWAVRRPGTLRVLGYNALGPQHAQPGAAHPGPPDERGPGATGAFGAPLGDGLRNRWRRFRLAGGFAAAALLALAGSMAALPRRARPPSHQSRGSDLFQVKASYGSMSDCLASVALSDFTSKAGMQLAGWFFNWEDEDAFKPIIDMGNGYEISDYIPRSSFWGFCRIGDGSLSLAMKGTGTLSLDYGNPFGDPLGNVTVSLNGVVKSTAPFYTFSKSVQLSYVDNDWMEIKEVGGVIVINSIIFNCEDAAIKSTTPKPAHTAEEDMDAEGRHGVEKAKKDFQDAYAQHQKNYFKLERKQDMFDRVSKLTNISRERAKNTSGRHPETNKSKTDNSSGNSTSETDDGTADKAKNTTSSSAKDKDDDDDDDDRDHAKLSMLRKQAEASKQELAEAKKEFDDSKAKEKQMAIRMRKKLDAIPKKERKKPDDHKKDDKEHSSHPSLYCYSLTMPFGYEPGLLAAQEKKGVGIFDCDAHVVISNSTTNVKTGGPLPISVSVVDMSLAVHYGGKWHTALNTDVFIHIWNKIADLGQYKNYDWTVKLDPDSVFFPNRLRRILAHRASLKVVSARRLRSQKGSCGNCQRHSFTRYTCEDSVRWLQQKGHNCSDALHLVSRPPPTDCGCKCNAIEACDVKSNTDLYEDGKVLKGKGDADAIYINNCKFGLHGPIEVLSQKAVTAFVSGLKKCSNLQVHEWGEDKFMDRCLLELGVTRVNQFSLLNEIACSETPAPCGGADVAFHPFKSNESYFACWSYAEKTGM